MAGFVSTPEGTSDFGAPKKGLAARLQRLYRKWFRAIHRGNVHGRRRWRPPSHRVDNSAFLPTCEVTIMADYRHGYVRFQNHEYKVTWHPISHEVYVYWGTDRYAGTAYDMQEALDTALSWLNRGR